MNHKTLAGIYLDGDEYDRALVKRIIRDYDEEEKLWFLWAIISYTGEYEV